ncbi:MAG: diguanylate cyclase (GGDEF)-like protein [Glaciecola sp.]|jgi:diguanylate cyclase (GGDEF)-like protein
MGSALYSDDAIEETIYRVLIIDDSEIELKLYINGLGQDFDVSFSPNAQTAWELLNSVPLPDAIVLDIQMPNEDGLQLCSRIKETQFIQDVPIIFISSLTDPAAKSQAFEAGGADFVAKPPIMSELIARLKRHVALYRKTKKLESLIFIDPLTHLPNASKFQEVLGIEWSRCARYWHHITLLMVRVENLDQIRDTEGNDKYFSTIAAVAEGLASAGNRPGDLVATLSNDKFAVLLSDCGHEGATLKAQQIMSKFESGELANTGAPLSCTVGFAVAAPAGGESSRVLFRSVENVMLESQQRGTGKIYPVNGVIGIDE